MNNIIWTVFAIIEIKPVLPWHAVVFLPVCNLDKCNFDTDKSICDLKIKLLS